MAHEQHLRWWRQATPVGEITVVVGPRGVAAIAFPGEDLGHLVGGAPPERDEAIAVKIDEWCAGHRSTLDLPVDLSGCSPFQRRVLETLAREVAYGETVSYGELAEMAGSPGAARAVGRAMATNPIPLVIPCHRVVAAGGRLGGYGGVARGGSSEPNLARKRALLAREGVTVRG